MEHQPPQQGGEQRIRGEVAPRIYVASLSDYNDGRLHGVWIDADQTAEELHEAIQKMLGHSMIAGAEEWAIHDYEGFGAIRLSEFESMETVSRIAAGIAEHGPAFSALVEIVGTDTDDALRHFEDHYQGRYDSMEAFAEQLADDLGWPEQLDRLGASLRPYVSIDYGMLARDLGTELYAVEADEGGVYVFDTRP
jgi:antirestriction protein